MSITTEFFNEKIELYNKKIVGLYLSKMKSLGYDEHERVSYSDNLSTSFPNNQRGQSRIFSHGKCAYSDSISKVSFYIGDIPASGKIAVSIEISKSSAKNERNFFITDQSFWDPLENHLLRIIESTMGLSLDIYFIHLLDMKNWEVNPIALKVEQRNSIISKLINQ